jgi:hypothetical protein
VPSLSDRCLQRSSSLVLLEFETESVFFAKLCVHLGDLCGSALSFIAYRKVRKVFRKERKAN